MNVDHLSNDQLVALLDIADDLHHIRDQLASLLYPVIAQYGDADWLGYQRAGFRLEYLFGPHSVDAIKALLYDRATS